MKNCFQVLIVLLLLFACSDEKKIPETNDPLTNNSPEPPHKGEVKSVDLTKQQATYLSSLPLKCAGNALPYKPGRVLTQKSDLTMPEDDHPAFYGCFDWHSAVHAHWSMVYLLRTFPDLTTAAEMKQMLIKNLSRENLEKELAYFSRNKYTKSFERTYGWAWLLKLAEELKMWEDEEAQQMYSSLSPLADHICEAYMEYLPKLVYPIRVGEHSNTAFGLSFAYDYAVATNNIKLKTIIEERAKSFYLTDKNCPINWEPSGYDFLSPCLEEMNLMRKILPKADFRNWLSDFFPSIATDKLNIQPATVKDRSDGKLVHLDGLNFSRAWCLYGLNQGEELNILADDHLSFSLSNVVDGDYAGEHWLASFALYALKTKAENQ